MKNLKKVLALVLVVATVLSFATVASAASFTDKASITNAEAVSMLADLGVINGFTDGSFQPTGKVTRAQMAKMIFVATTGDDDATGFQGTSTKLTDISGHWAEGYIKYCYSLGIIAGFTDGTFKPEQNVTIAQAAKMLLVALGYDADQYTGASWSVNTMRDAKKADVTKDVVGASILDANRDTAALMIFNTLFADCVDPEYQYDMGVKYVTGHQKNGHTLGRDFFDVAKTEGIITAASKDSVTVDGIAYDLAGSYDMLGKNGIVYYKTKSDHTTFKSLYSSAVIVNEDGVKYKTVNGDSLYKSAVDSSKKKVTLVEGADKLTVIANGASAKKSASDIKDTAADKNLGYDNGKGTEVLYIDSDNDSKVDVIKITNYSVAKVNTYNTSAKTLTLQVKKNVGAAVASTWKFEDVVDVDSFAKGDYVTFVAYNDMLNMFKTTVVSGKVDSKVASSSSIKVDGTAYAFSANAADGSTFADAGIGDEGKWYVDANGYIVFFDGTSKVSTDNMAYVMKVDTVGTFTDTQEVKLGFTDGTTAVVTVAKYAKTKDGKAEKVSKSGFDVPAGIIVTYTVSDGKYTLKKVDTDTANADGTAITKGKPQTISGATTNTSTLFIDLDNGAVYTGYSAVPSQTATNAMIYKDGKKVVAMFITKNDVTGDKDSTKFYIYKTNAYDENKDADDNVYRTYTAIVDGEVKNIDIMADVAPAAKGLYSVEKVNKNGVATEITSVVAQTAITANVGYTDKEGVLTVNGKDYVLNGNTIYYMISAKDNTATLVDAASLDGEWYDETNKTNVKDTLYVQVVDADAKPDNADSYTAAIVYMITK